MNNPDRNRFIEELSEKLQSYRNLRGDLYRESLREQYGLAKRFYELLLESDGVPDSRMFDDISMSVEADVTGWIVELPFALNDQGGMSDEAVEIGNLFAEVHSPDNFFGDMAVILAEAGRREEAFERVSKNLERFPDDVWIIIKGGQAYQVLKETEKALELYTRAYGMTEPLSYDRDGVLERLIPLLTESGRDAEADILVENEERAERERKERYKRQEREETKRFTVADTPKSVQAISRKIGRNEPCPCASGKKYKKCCGK